MLIKEVKYCYDDVMVVPSAVSNVEHRSDCNPYIGNNLKKKLPIFTAPMSTVVCENNFNIFEQNGITPILPRNISLETRIEYTKNGKWVAFGLDEFENLFLKNDWDMQTYPDVKVLIDAANGHMSKLHYVVYDTKVKYNWQPRFNIMVGNISNPQAYEYIARAGADYVRLSIGTGFGCLTATNCGVGYGIASLIDETYQVKRKLNHIGQHTPYIIADGGIRNYSDIIKALALGADFVMIGSVFASLVESASTPFTDNNGLTASYDQFEQKIEHIGGNRFLIDNDYIISDLKKEFYGMASRRGQEDMKGEKTRTSEGVEKVINVTTNINKWVENMASYIQSTMSYTNCFYLDDFTPDNVDCVIISEQTKKSINK